MSEGMKGGLGGAMRAIKPDTTNQTPQCVLKLAGILGEKVAVMTKNLWAGGGSFTGIIRILGARLRLGSGGRSAEPQPGQHANRLKSPCVRMLGAQRYHRI